MGKQLDIHANPSIFSGCLFSNLLVKQVSQIDIIFCLHKVFPFKKYKKD